MKLPGALLVITGCVSLVLASSSGPITSTPYVWQLPKGFPKPVVPPDNPMTLEKVDLGRHLFYDKRLSVNEMQSCASCHRQERAFADDKPVSTGATGEHGIRKAMSLVNVAYAGALTWSNPALRKLEDQALVPMFGSHPVELGLDHDNRFLQNLGTDATYKRLFVAAFPGDREPVTLENVTRSIACFERTLISGGSPYDHYHFQGDDNAMSEPAKRGEELFFSQEFACFQCHGGFNFSDATVTARESQPRIEFHNTGLYNVSGSISYPKPNVGIHEHTHRPEDVGKFKAPSLRNVALHAPYMHDGSIATLEEALDHYAAGGRTIASGPHAGVGKDNPNKDRRIAGFQLTAQDRKALVDFLRSLSDASVATNPSLGNPWRVTQHASEPPK
jgi:cytochrome c peroxidase